MRSGTPPGMPVNCHAPWWRLAGNLLASGGKRSEIGQLASWNTGWYIALNTGWYFISSRGGHVLLLGLAHHGPHGAYLLLRIVHSLLGPLLLLLGIGGHHVHRAVLLLGFLSHHCLVRGRHEMGGRRGSYVLSV